MCKVLPESVNFPADYITAVIINYGTPELTRRAVWSLRSLYPKLPILVVDNHSPDDSLEQMQALAPDVQPFELLASKHNRHHGPGLDHAIRHLQAEWVLAFDSDCLAYRRGFLEAMMERAREHTAYMVGALKQVDEDGFVMTNETSGHPYIHPKCALVRRAAYLELPPFEKHGAPCLANQIAAAERGHALIGFPVSDYVFHLGRGTASRYGYQLGLKGWIGKMRHRLYRALS